MLQTPPGQARSSPLRLPHGLKAASGKSSRTCVTSAASAPASPAARPCSSSFLANVWGDIGSQSHADSQCRLSETSPAPHCPQRPSQSLFRPHPPPRRPLHPVPPFPRLPPTAACASVWLVRMLLIPPLLSPSDPLTANVTLRGGKAVTPEPGTRRGVCGHLSVPHRAQHPQQPGEKEEKTPDGREEENRHSSQMNPLETPQEIATSDKRTRKSRTQGEHPGPEAFDTRWRLASLARSSHRGAGRRALSRVLNTPPPEQTPAPELQGGARRQREQHTQGLGWRQAQRGQGCGGGGGWTSVQRERSLDARTPCEVSRKG